MVDWDKEDAASSGRASDLLHSTEIFGMGQDPWLKMPILFFGTDDFVYELHVEQGSVVDTVFLHSGC